mgnify:FL=1
MNIQNGSYLSIAQLQDQYPGTKARVQTTGEKESLSFQEIFDRKATEVSDGSTVAEKTEEIRFSKHASNRLADRNIELSQSQLERLNTGAERASEKGIKESLVLVDDLAFIVNVKNNTVITAMDQNETSENIFTNIDGAVIA